MKRLLLLLPLGLFLVLAAVLYRGLFLDPSRLPSPLIGKPVPSFLLSSTNDSSLSLTQDDLKGSPALINVWGTWCPSCREEHAVLNALAKQGVIIYGINYKDDRADAQRWLKNLQNPYRLTIHDADGSLGLNLGVYGAPETFLIDSKGIIRDKYVGAIDMRVWHEKLEPIYHKLVAENKQ
ncbi:DsbE family thiol:disulfide interchange protein [Methylophilus sp. QUAN]|uniref:DsbE family thiol:disulfide interchange protein n=1 Tax=Methylophilus sp. QUAN TaxID=2781020 RepID=UPI00188EBF16|nr:DsbE family thiol:disulfide interchange protein [Methylophilus sp. QUAN]MBF4991838.1 DsbE family thiol:disulfide interchange protein [Methylophilus sp. QUAN]